MALNAADLLRDAARRTPDAVAVSDDRERLTFTELDELSARFAAALHAAGIGHGDRVLIGPGNTPHFPVAFYGALRAGAVAVPVNPLLSPRDVEHFVRDSEVAWAVIAEPFLDRFVHGVHAAGRVDLPIVVSHTDHRGTDTAHRPGYQALEELLRTHEPAPRGQDGRRQGLPRPNQVRRPLTQLQLTHTVWGSHTRPAMCVSYRRCV